MRDAIRFPLCETTSGESGLGACLPSHKKTCTGPPGQAETQTSKNPLQSGQRHSARPRIQAGRISPLSPPSEVSDILNASRRLNSLAPLESLKKKMREREREKKGPKLAIIELVLFCGRKSFQEALLEQVGPDKKTMPGSHTRQRGTRAGRRECGLLRLRAAKERGTPRSGGK